MCIDMGPGYFPGEPPIASELRERWHFCRRLRGNGVVSKIAGGLSIVGVGFVGFLVIGPGAKLYRKLGLHLERLLGNISGLRRL
jgi:hypothetical protein